MKLEKISYTTLSSKQKEIFNFQKVAGLLADYGFNCIKLADDWQGADFLAYHKDGNDTLKVQLKGRMTISKKYIGRNLYICFPHKDSWYLVIHDELIAFLEKTTNYLQTESWRVNGSYHSATPSQQTMSWLESSKL